jgi:hypothetical protein
MPLTFMGGAGSVIGAVLTVLDLAGASLGRLDLVSKVKRIAAVRRMMITNTIGFALLIMN